MSTVRETFGNPSPNVWIPEKKLIPKFGASPDLLLGVELEIEGLEPDEDHRERRCVSGMNYHKDGSLRNNGGEFVTYPMTLNHLDYVLDTFFHKNKLSADNYSERCSVHIHANCLDMQLEEVRLLLAVYQIMEKVLFDYIKEERHNNIFCVPWNECYLPQAALRNDNSLITKIKTWKKYTALNLLPLTSLGTIEFRHMAGTNDKDRIVQWCDIIGSLFKYTREHKFEEIKGTLTGLNTTSAYLAFMNAVFEPHLADILCVGNYREHLEEGALNMKLALIDNKFKTKESPLRGRNPAPVGRFEARVEPDNLNNLNNFVVHNGPAGGFDDEEIVGLPAPRAAPRMLWPDRNPDVPQPRRFVWLEGENGYNHNTVWLYPSHDGEQQRCWNRKWDRTVGVANRPPAADITYEVMKNWISVNTVVCTGAAMHVWQGHVVYMIYNNYGWEYNLTTGRLESY